MAKIISLFISQNPDALFHPMYIYITNTRPPEFLRWSGVGLFNYRKV